MTTHEKINVAVSLGLFGIAVWNARNASKNKEVAYQNIVVAERNQELAEALEKSVRRTTSASKDK